MDLIPWLIVVLRSRPCFAWAPTDLFDGFMTDGEEFRVITDQERPELIEFPMFFDRLFDRTGVLVGIQVSPLAVPELPLFTGGIQHVRSVNGGKQVQIFFGDHPEQIIDSGDQAFGGRIYKSNFGTFALTFDTFVMTESERDIVKQADVTWTTAVPARGGPSVVP